MILTVGFRGRFAWDCILAPSLAGCVILGKLPNLSHPENEDNDSTYLIGLLGEHFMS